jgi:hypothetical protein
MAHQKKNRAKKIKEKESSHYNLVKKIQSLTVKIEKEHLLRDELLNRKSALECFWENEKEIIKVSPLHFSLHILNDLD